MGNRLLSTQLALSLMVGNYIVVSVHREALISSRNLIVDCQWLCSNIIQLQIFLRRVWGLRDYCFNHLEVKMEAEDFVLITSFSILVLCLLQILFCYLFWTHLFFAYPKIQFFWYLDKFQGIFSYIYQAAEMIHSTTFVWNSNIKLSYAHQNDLS